MVHGLEQFRNYFEGYEGNYVIIGGTACEIHEETFAQMPRATKDIDMVLIVEALSNSFVERFWEFVKSGGYGNNSRAERQDGTHVHEYYRFKKPSIPDYPFQIELFSRHLGLLDFPAEAHITPIPNDDADLSSLSAILMDDDYYSFTIEHSRVYNGLHICNIEGLICLKAKAYLEMIERKSRGEQVDSRHIAKHKKDIFRLAAMLAPVDRYVLPDKLRTDMNDFCDVVSESLPNADFFKSAGIGDFTGDELLKQVQISFIPNK